MISLHLRGHVRVAETGAGAPGLFVKAYDKDLLFDDLLGTAVTGPDGEFAIVSEAGDFRDLFERRPDVYLRVYDDDRETVLYATEDAVRWNAGRYEDFDVRVPRDRLGHHVPPRAVRVVGDDGAERASLPVGESLVIEATGLRPATVHTVEVADDDGVLFVDSVLSDAAGAIEPTVVWPLLGLEDPRATVAPTVEEALARWAGRRVRVRVADGDATVGEGTVTVPAEPAPLAVSVDDDGRVLNGFEAGTRPVTVHLQGLTGWESARVFLVPRQHEWRPGDRLAPVAVADVEVDPERAQQVVVARAGEVGPGAYDFVVRRVRYGYEDADDLTLRPDDVVGDRRVTGVVLREEFWASKVVRGGCANLQPIAARRVSGAPYVEYTDVFQAGENVYGALDPAALDPGHTGKMVAIYVVPHKTAAQWNMDSSLQHLPVLGGNAAVQRWLTQSQCVNANLRLLWANANLVGEYDVVADFGNNTADPMAFSPDDSYDQPLDIIDGYVVAGFRVVRDPTVDTSHAFAGTFTYTETTEGTFAVNDDDFGATWPAVPVRARVFFPADVAGATLPGQISAARPSYPVVVVVHGNSFAHQQDSYLGYDYLLSHLARNGFIAASVHCSYDMKGTGRARVLRKHLDLLFAKFGTKAANNVGVMGHSRGGEGVAIAARLNAQEAWGYDINAVISLAPTDQYTYENLGGAWATPYFVLYGSLDGDVSGPDDTGFRLYDRASGAPKSMAFVYGACHGRFNTLWGFTAGEQANLHASDHPRVLNADTHEKIAKGYMTAFFRQHLRAEAQWRGIFTGDWMPAAPKAATPGLRVYLQYEDPGQRDVDTFEGPHTATSWQTSTIAGAVTQTGLPATPVEAVLDDIDDHSPHVTSGLHLRWDGTGDAVTWVIPAGSRDVTSYAAVSFRITQVTDSPHNAAGQPQDLRVTLTDGSGNARAVRVSKLGEVPYPDVHGWNYYTKSALCTVRIPLSAYTIRCLGMPEVDLTDVVRVAFEFAEKPTGEIHLDSIQFTS